LLVQISSHVVGPNCIHATRYGKQKSHAIIKGLVGLHDLYI
jgi:hypothetical protein